MADPYASFSSPASADPYAAFASPATNVHLYSPNPDAPTSYGGPTQEIGPQTFGEHVASTLKSIPGDVADLYKRAGDYRDTQFAKAMGGVAGLPRLGADIVNWGANTLGLPAPIQGASSLPTSDQASKFMLDRAKARPGFEERSINPVVDAGVQALFSGPVMGAGGRLGPAINFGAGATSEAAGDIAYQISPSLEVPARLAGGVLGAGLGGGTAALAGSIPSRIKAAVKPFTTAGRDELVSRILNETAADPQAATAGMDRYLNARQAYPEAVPGFRLGAGKASMDPGLMQLEEVAGAKNPGLRSTVQANNDALNAALDRVTAGGDPKAFIAELAKQDTGAAMRAQAALDALPPGADAATAGLAIQNALRGRYDSLIAARKEASDPLYTAARSSTTPVNPWPLMTSTADLLAATKGEPQSVVQNVRNLLFNPDGTPDRTAAGMMATREAIGSLQDNPHLAKFPQSLLADLKGKANEALSVVPEEQQAREAFARLSKPLEPFDAKLGNQTTASVIKQDPYGKDFLMAPDQVPGRYFRPGDAGGAAMREFFAARGDNPQLTQTMQSFIADKARSAPNLQAFLKQYGPAIDTFNPSFRGQLENAATTGNLAAGFRSSPAGKFLNGDLDAAVGSTLGAPDSVKRMQALRMSVGSSPEAVAGLQKAVIDDFKRAASSSTQKDPAGNPMLMASGASRWLQANRGAVSNVLSPDQLTALDEITKHLGDQAQTVPGRVGSPTYDRLATESIISGLLHPVLTKLPVFHALKTGLGLVAKGADEAVRNRLFEAIGDPDVARALMRKATPQNVKLAEPVVRKLLGATAAAANRPDQSSGRTSP